MNAHAPREQYLIGLHVESDLVAYQIMYLASMNEICLVDSVLHVYMILICALYSTVISLSISGNG